MPIDTSSMDPSEAMQVTMFETLLTSMETEALEVLHKIIGDTIKERKREAKRG